MYTTSGVAGVSTAAATGLASTGVQVGWTIAAAFALVSAGLALLRLVPRREA